MTIMHIGPRSGIRWPDILRAAPMLVLFKHSPHCGFSRAAELDIRDFANTHPQLPVLQVDVIRQRELSTLIARHLDIPHASPQIILLERGVPVWSAQHGRVTAAALEGALAASATK
ncbi:MAG: DUF2847 family protein [Gemmatimonadales bacterium]|nr:DUF2847 family protein [Gemmatimonadales bacterium]